MKWTDQKTNFGEPVGKAIDEEKLAKRRRDYTPDEAEWKNVRRVFVLYL